MKNDLPDIQNGLSEKLIPINKVGIKGIKYPIKILDKMEKYQHTVANISMYVDLPAHYKGTHMSRFIEILAKYHKEISIKQIIEILKEMKDRLNAKTSHIEIEFPFFREKKAPVSGQVALLDYTCKMVANYSDHFDYFITIKVPVHTLCPCSKEISRFSAHNQRSFVTVIYRAKKVVWIEDIIDIVEKNASAQIYSLLKREDEKYVTEYAYEHPKFVEDIVRDVASELEKMNDIFYYKVEAENMESIHNHNAYACIEKVKNG